MKSFFALLIFVSAVLSVQTNRESSHATLAFTHVAVIDTANATVQQNMTVVIIGDRITSVGKSGRVRVPANAKIIDAAGKYLMPGLWDMHVHTFRHNPRSTNTWYFPLFIANGITGVRDMGTTGDDFPQVVQFRKGLADGTMLVPRYGAVGWMVDGPKPFWPNSDVVSTPQEAREFVRKVKASGIDFVKVYTGLRPEEYFAIVDEAKKIGIPFAGHPPDTIRAAAASDAGQRSMEHLRNIPLGCSTKEEELMPSKTWGPQQEKEMRETYDQARCERLVEKFARNQTWQVPTSWMFLQDRSRFRELLTTDPKSKYLPADVRALWQQRLPKLEPSPQQEEQRQKREEQRQEGQRQTLMIIGMMNKAGVPMMAGTDVGNPFLLPGFSLHDELVAFVRAGLTPGEALKTATYNPAKFLGMLDRLGTIEKGKLADLVLLDENPLEDIHNTQKIRAVVLNGRYLDRAALDKMLVQAEANANRRGE